MKLRTPVVILLSDYSREGLANKNTESDYDVVNCNKGTILFTGKGFDCLCWIRYRFWLELIDADR